MVSLRHEAPIKLIRDNPEVIGQLLSKAFDITVPENGLVIAASEEFTKAEPAVFRGDNVAVFYPADPDAKEPRFAVVVEQQLKKDTVKEYTWPVYLTELHCQKRCPTLLVVICPKRSVAEWARTPIEIGHPGLTLVPLVVGPDTTPLVTTTTEAMQKPLLALVWFLAGLAGRPDHHALELVHAALATIDKTSHQDAASYAGMLTRLLSKAALEDLRKLMKEGTAEISSWFFEEEAAEAMAQGRAEGQAGAILRLLENRGIDVTSEARQRIVECVDKAQLDVWLDRVLDVETAEQLFD